MWFPYQAKEYERHEVKGLIYSVEFKTWTRIQTVFSFTETTGAAKSEECVEVL